MNIITRVERRFLKVLMACPQATREQLAQTMNRSPARVSQLVHALRARGLVEGTEYGALLVTVDPMQCHVAYKDRGWQVRDRLRRQSLSHPNDDIA